jgi:hypothetical protein
VAPTTGTAAADDRVHLTGRRQRGQVAVLFALLVPMLLALGAAVIGVGNWYVHAKHLQTKADAAVFAGGSAWGFPCGADIDLEIETLARTYVGPHMKADGTAYAGTTFNPQVGGVGESQIHAVLNGSAWYDDDSNRFPTEKDSPLSTSICESKVLDVKATEDNSFPLASLIPLFPDIKRKARVEIQEIAGLTGLLPIAVRLPQPLSAAAVFYDESSPTKEILDVEPFRHVCIDADPGCIIDAPPGLGQWTTEPKAGSGGTWARFLVRPYTGVVIATSVRPRCGVGTPPAGQPCLDPGPSWIGRSVDDLCRSAGTAVQCFDADGGGATQTVHSGIHLIRGHGEGDVGDGRPEVRRAWLEKVGCPATGYFNSLPGSCTVKLSVVVDIGSLEENVPPDPPDELVQTRTADNIEVRYCLVRTGETGAAVCDPQQGADQFGVDQDLQCTGGPGEVTCSTVLGTDPLIALDSRENAFAIQVRMRRTTVPDFAGCTNDPDSDYANTCRFFYTGEGYVGDSVPPTGAAVLAAPVHRSFMGHLERTGPVKWLRLTVDGDCDENGLTLDDRVIGHDYATGTDADAATQLAGDDVCYVVDLGMAGGLARDQDEPPIAFNLGDNSSQRAYVDCDPDIPNLKSEIVSGCRWPSYAANTFGTTPYCPGPAAFFDRVNPPVVGWPPYRCVLTQTGNSSQVIQGFNERIFGVSNNPKCPADDAATPRYIGGRNYWHRLNNAYDAETFAWDGTGSGVPPDLDGTAKGNTLRSDDPRLVTLFFTTYDSFTSTGNEVFPIVGFGNFYVTGYGETINGAWKGGEPEDPCGQGSGLALGAGNAPPADLDMSRNTRWVWGHFVKDVTPAPFTTGGSGVLCNPEASFQPCVAVLVE